MLNNMKSALKVINISLIGAILSACGSNNTEQSVMPTQQAQLICKSVHKNEDLIPDVSAPLITFKVPVSRSNDSQTGLSVVFLVNTNSIINIYWAALNSQQELKMADKQTVIRVQQGEVNAQPMHRLNSRVYPKVVLFVSIPDVIWQKSNIKIVPVVKKPDFRWGRVQGYNTRITAQGIQHAFRGIDNTSPNQKLSPRLNQVLNKIELGSIYVPQRYNNNIHIEEPIGVNQEICPKTKAE
jgi:hypothetical protein